MDINDAWVIGRNDDNYDSFCPFLKLNEAEKWNPVWDVNELNTRYNVELWLKWDNLWDMDTKKMIISISDIVLAASIPQ